MEARAVPPDAASGRTLEAAVGRSRLSSRALALAPDASLVNLVRQEDVVAFESIYDRYHRGIYSFCRHLLSDPEEAADVVQHTFLAAYSAIISSEKPILLRAWLYTIARNRCYSVLRARREQPSAELAEPVSEGLTTHVLRREDLRQLLVDMRRLPEDQRTALVLSGLGTLNHQQVAETLGVPATKVKALVFQARESLQAAQTARETDCSEIREQLTTLRGAALRRGNLRRHLQDCPACREFSGQAELQRRRVRALPPTPVMSAPDITPAIRPARTGVASAPTP
ncbi:MAG TPA: RNA polymerase sigma factor [Solirubrobacteraceae bacterium]|nr:RNA polymerase sigma factor [Solirubrobacteraceae bacterium]